jgi:8-oxo-dGTP pyrophosphatase MutT (NUDIX family)
MDKNQIHNLEFRLSKSLPGWEAQKKLSPIKTGDYRSPSDHAVHAGVNLLLHPNEADDLELFYIKRPSNNPLDKHGGQISFPGGKQEHSDKDMIETALRETMEEIGVPVQEMKVLGTLSPLYVYVSNFLVHPIVSYIDHKPELQLQKSEVNYVINESVIKLQSENAVNYIDHQVRDYIIRDMPHYKLQNDILWGATAMITAEFLQIVKEL